MRKLPLAAVAPALMLGSAGGAQNAPKPMTRAQYSTELDSGFAAADTNHDGTLSIGELQALQNRELQAVEQALRNRIQAQFKALDTNKDGQLSLAEFSAATPRVRVNETSQQILQKLDTNKDGKVSQEEFRAPRLDNFNKADLNHDGILTPAELQSAKAQKK